ncbi:MAG TPA: RHS repeat-associated core domain-containing protein [Steroidobacteraceae bacterium]|nr:RHS repeat-associated core domain-containing protein [Steroidobacteraceae bacterium]
MRACDLSGKFFKRSCLAAVGALLVHGVAYAALPSANLLSAPPVATSTLSSYSIATPTPGVAAWAQTPPEFVALARTLGLEHVLDGQMGEDVYAQNVFDYVRNNIALELRFGLGKGGYGALVEQSGTPFDQAELMYKLLKMAQIPVEYRMGTATLTAAQFAQMTGSFTALTPAIVVDARQACQLLADGGIPTSLATTSCNNASGNATNITFGHVWLAASPKNKAGTTLSKLYDPSFKTHTLVAPTIDIPSWLGCGTFAASTCGSGMIAAANAQPGTRSGSFKNFDEPAIGTYLRARAVALQGQIQINNRLAFAEDVVGGKRLVNTVVTANDTLPYTAAQTTSWTTNIPDSLRTTFRVRFKSGSERNVGGVRTNDQLFYADEIGGRILQLNSEGYFNITGGTIAPGATNQCPACLAWLVVLDVNHPYAAPSNYGDEHVEMEMFNPDTGFPDLPDHGAFPLTLVLSLGNGSPAAEKHISAIQEGSFAEWDDAWNALNSQGFTTRYDKHYESKDQPVLAAKLMSQGAAADRLLQGITRSNITRHHDMGVVYGHPDNPSSMTLMSVQSALSVNTNSSANTATLRTATFEAAATTWAMLEGSVAGQMNNSGAGLSSATAFSNNRGFDYYQLTPAQILSEFPAGGSNVYTQRYRDAANLGWGVVLNSRTDVQIFTKAGGVAHTLYAALKGASDYNKDPISNAMKSTELTDQAAERKKYLNVSPADGTFTLKQTDLVTGVGGFPQALPFTRTYRSDGFVRDATVMSTINTQQGLDNTSYSASNAHQYEAPDAAATSHLGGGWTHNYHVYASYTSNGGKALGADNALESTNAIAALWTLVDAARSPTLTGRVASELTAHWLATKLFYNAATIDAGGNTETFQELADDSMYSAKGSARLTKTGDLGWLPSALTYTGHDGDVINFVVGKWKKYPTRTGNGVQPLPDAYFVASNWTFPDGTVVTFEYEGQFLVLTYDGGSDRFCAVIGGTPQCIGPPSAIDAPYGLVLKAVYNNFGRRLDFATDSSTVPVPNPDGPTGYVQFTSMFRIKRVTDENNRYVDYTTPGCSGVSFACGTFSVTKPNNVGPATLTETYTYQAGTDSPAPAFTFKGDYRLRRWYTPEHSDTANDVAYRTFTYDPLYRVSRVRDARGNPTFYYAGAVAETENWKRAEVVSGVGAVAVNEFDRLNGALRTIDGLGRITTNEYDNVGRLLRTVNPEGDSVVKTYDARSNVTSTTRKGKPGSGLTDAVVTTTYGEANTVLNCVTPTTCNKPVLETDAKGYVRRNSWDPATGLLTRVETGLNSSLTCHSTVGTVCPQYDLVSTPAQTNGVFMLRQTTQRLNASLNLVNTFTYQPSNHWTLLTGVNDSGSGRPNQTTTLTFDAVGNLTQADGPRTDVSDVRNFTWDQLRRLRLAIDADPDGAGTLPRIAVRTSYDRDSLVTTSEKGTTTNATGTDFAAVETTAFAYDLVGNKTRVTNPVGVTQFAYDQDDRLICSAVRMNPDVYGSLPVDDSSTQFITDDGACVLSTTSAKFGADRITHKVYDMASQVTLEQRGYRSGVQQDYMAAGYTLNGKQDWVEDANGNRSDLVYDGFDRLCRLYFPQTTKGSHKPNTGQDESTLMSCSSPDTGDYEMYAYDPNDNRTSFRKRGTGTASARTITYEYDALNRETRKNLPGSDTYDVHTRYDLANRKLFQHFGASAGSVSTDCSATATGIDYCYDRLGRVTRDNGYGRPIDYQYDEAGNRERITWPGATNFVEYTYDAMNRMKLVCETDECSGSILATYNYDALGRRGTISRQNGAATSFGYDGASRITSIAQDMSGTANDVTFEMQLYNPASQAMRIRRTNNIYDDAPAAANKNYTPDGLNRYTEYGYDARGNLTSDGTRTFIYDIENRLTDLTGPSTLKITYDPNGRLNQTKVGVDPSAVYTTFLYDGDRLTAEYNGTGSTATVLRRYVHGANVDEPLVWYEGSGFTDRRWFQADQQGSVIATTNASGVATSYAYGPYGEPKGDDWTGARFRYTGQIVLNDAPGLKLYYYKARVYDPVIGRFMQTDPVGSRSDQNLYAYVSNDPLNKADPSGEVEVEDASQARKWYQTNTDGHHYVPFGSTVTGSDGKKLDISSDARKVFGASTTGEKLPSGNGVHGWNEAHAKYNAAVTKELEKFAKTNKINLAEMTTKQAQAFVSQIKGSSLPSIRNFLAPIEKFTAGLRAASGGAVGRMIYRASNSLYLVQVAENMRSPETGACKMSKFCNANARNEGSENDDDEEQ